MSLVVRFTILFIMVSMVVFGVGGVLTYQIMKREIDFEQRGFLLERMDNIVDFIERTDLDQPLTRGKWSIQPLPELQEETDPVFSDTIVIHATLQRPEPHLKLDVIRNVNDRSYSISLYDLIIESDDINDVVVESLGETFLILLVSFSVLGLVIFYFQIRPFHRTLEIIKEFSLAGSEEIHFEKTSIREFRRLNHFLQEMTDKIRRDYKSLKEFSENASHELQTPIAIILGKLDMLLEDERLSEGQLELVSSIQLTAKRLSNMSNSLSLLTKIENLEFKSKDTIDIRSKLEQIVADFRELLDLKEINCTLEVKGSPTVKGDEVLIEILISNLINNAMKHNNEEKQIKILLDDYSLDISNTGPPLKIAAGELFQRFKKSNQSGSSMGLGLAIVKKICDLYGFEIFYENRQNSHHLKVNFEKSPSQE